MAESTLIGPHVLTGWKEIAKYLGMGVRTVQRHEQQSRLPIRRALTNPRGAVIATPEELDAWVTTLPLREAKDRYLAPEIGFCLELERLRAGVREMRRLRAEMVGLRVELVAAARALKENAVCFREMKQMPRQSPHQMQQDTTYRTPKQGRAA